MRKKTVAIAPFFISSLHCCCEHVVGRSVLCLSPAGERFSFILSLLSVASCTAPIQPCCAYLLSFLWFLSYVYPQTCPWLAVFFFFLPLLLRDHKSSQDLWAPALLSLPWRTLVEILLPPVEKGSNSGINETYATQPRSLLGRGEQQKSLPCTLGFEGPAWRGGNEGQTRL